jgi:hypothetical protein
MGSSEHNVAMTWEGKRARDEGGIETGAGRGRGRGRREGGCTDQLSLLAGEREPSRVEGYKDCFSAGTVEARTTNAFTTAKKKNTQRVQTALRWG